MSFESEFATSFLTIQHTVLEKHKVCTPTEFIAAVNAFAATEDASLTVREMLNRFWDHQVGSVRTNSIEVRRCFVNYPDMSDEVWHQNFEEYVVPFLKKYHLPRG